MDEQVGAIAGPENENQIAEQVAEQIEEVKAEAKTEEVKAEPKESPQETSERPKRNGFTRKIEKQQARIDALEQQLATLAPKPVDTEAKRPNFEEYEKAGKTWADFIQDTAQYEAKSLVEAKLKETQEQSKRQAWESEQQRLRSEYQNKAKEFAKNTPDFYDVTGAVDFDMTPALSQAILESDKAAEVTYYLAKNPDLADDLNAMPYGKVARELGKIEARLESPKTVKTTTAPAPINPVGSKSKGSLDPYSRDLSYEEHLEYRARQN